MKDFFLGLDLGTTGVKVGLFDEDGATAAFARREMPLEAPAPGRAEFDAEEYAAAAFSCVREALSTAGVAGEAVKGLGFSSQAETFVLTDEPGRPLRRALSWLDVRAEAEARELTEISRRAGGEKVDALCSGPKILWLRRHEPELLRRARRVLLLPDYFIYRLTGRAATDPVTAGSSGLCEPRARLWRPELLEACGLAAEMMPEILFTGEPAGMLTRAAAVELGLSEKTLVVVGTNDQYAGAVGVGNVVPGCVSVAFGTALALAATAASRESAPPEVGTAQHPAGGGARDDLYVLLAFAKTSGIVLRWLRDNFAADVSYDELFGELAGVPLGADGLTCLPHFSGTATPDFNASARGAFYGLTLAHGRAHMARALVEALSFTVRENVELLGRAVPVKALHAWGGGAKSDVWMQMVADATGWPVERPRTLEAACLGAAEPAMAAVGRFASIIEASRALYAVERRFEPDGTKKAAYDEAYARYRKLYRTLYGAGESPAD